RSDTSAAGRQYQLLYPDCSPPLAVAGIAYHGTRRGKCLMRFLEEDEDDPLLSMVNLIDLFLVVIGILLVIIVQNPLNPFTEESVIVIENPGQSDMRMTIKDGEELTRYEASGEIGEGQGSRAGVTYRLNDGRMIYIPEG